MGDTTDRHAGAFKDGLFLALENPGQAPAWGKFLAGAIYVCIIANAILVCIPDRWTSGVVGMAVFTFNMVSAAVFGCEYLARIWVADRVYPKRTAARARLRYVISPMGIVDLLSFLPSCIMLFVPMTPALRDVVSIIRLIRLIKISRYMRGLRTIGIVLSNRRSEIIASIMVLGLLTISASVLMYEAEHTALGRIIGFVVMVLSIAVVAIPAGIFSAGFVEEFRAQRNRRLPLSAQSEADEADEEE